jgi:hypothetical protein
MRFALFGAPNVRNKVRIATDIHLDPTSFDPDAPTEDWLVLELAGQDNAPEPGAVVLSSPTRWGELVIVGLDTNKLLLHRIDRALGQGSTTSGTLLEPRVELGPVCRAGFVEKGLIFHSCRTELGMSGAPVFQIDDSGALTLVGIHLGGSGRLESFCAREYENALPNFALALPEGVRNKIKALLAKP